MGSPPGPVAGGAPRVWRASLHIAYVTPSRLATRTASSNSPSACACHLDVVTLRRFTPATGGGGGGRGYTPSSKPRSRKSNTNESLSVYDGSISMRSHEFTSMEDQLLD